MTQAPANHRPSSRGTLGVCHVMYAFDIAQAIDLERAETLLRARSDIDQAREGIRVTRRAPAALGYQAKPVKLTMSCAPLTIAALQTHPRCEVLAFDFGALSVSFKIALDGPLESLVTLGSALWDHPGLLQLARDVVGRTISLLEGTPSSPGALLRVAVDSAVEDFVVYQLDRGALGEPQHDARSRIGAHALTFARVLRAESGAMAQEEIDEALHCQASYSPDDCVLVDWNAAVIIGPPAAEAATPGSAAGSDAEDVLAVLEYANVELLEMRALDDRLDRAVDQAYAGMTRGGPSLLRYFGAMGGFAGLGAGTLRHVARMQMDSAVLFEGVNNAIKLVGDQYLARVYRLAVRRFHLAERDEGIERKLRTLESLYEKLSTEASARRLEILEWIVIVLIAISIVLPFLGAK